MLSLVHSMWSIFIDNIIIVIMMMKDQHVLLRESAFQSKTILKTYNLTFHFPVKIDSAFRKFVFSHLLSKDRTTSANTFLCDRDTGNFNTTRGT